MVKSKNKNEKEEKDWLAGEKKKGGCTVAEASRWFLLCHSYCLQQAALVGSEGLETDHFLRRTLPVRFPIGRAPPFWARVPPRGEVGLFSSTARGPLGSRGRRHLFPS